MMVRRLRSAWAIAVTLVMLGTVAQRATAACVGDCNGDNAVSINELVTGVNIALGRGSMASCTELDQNGNGSVTVNELVSAVTAALSGCIPGGGQGLPDTTPPAMTQAWALTSTSVLVSFSEPLRSTSDDLSAEDASNYTIEPTTIVTGARLNPARTQVLLTTLPLVAGLEYTVTGSERLKDEAGNRLVAGASTAPNYPANAQNFVFSGQSGVDDRLPRVVSAASTGNTSVIVSFSKPMADDATDAAHYVIVQQNVNPEAGALLVVSASLSDDRTRVQLTTRSQNEVVYSVTVVDVTDRAGTPLGPKEIIAGVVVDPATAIFPGTPPSCPPLRCTNGDPGLNGTGLCASDDDCTRTPPCTTGSCVGACPSPCTLQDTDGDGLPDSAEQRGWVVTIKLGDGSTEQRQVTSNPDLADTDGDGLSDYEEAQIRTNPRDRDTDDDLIDDATEWNVLYSDPLSQDSDGDGLLDGTEVQFTKTSSIMDDSDGDGLTDSDELFAFNRDPLVADVPDVMITVGDVRLQIEETFSYTDEQGDTVSEEATTDTTLSRTESGSFANSHERHENHLDEFAAGIDFGINGGGVADDSCLFQGVCIGGITLLANVERTQTFDNGDLWADSSESAHESQNAFETTAARVREHSGTSSVTREVTGARIDVDLTITNTSDIAFTARDIEVTVLQRNPLDTKGFIPVATLVSNRALVSGEPLAVTLGPLKKQAGPFLFTSRDVFATLVQELMRAPQGLVFKVANYELTDEFGRNFTFTGQTVHDRTVQVVIDSGDMGAERAFAATSTAQDDGYLAGGGLLGGFGDKGRATGLPLDYVLQGILGMKKFRPTAIVAGADGTADSQVKADTDDVQVIAPGTTGLDFHSVVIDPGQNGRIDSPVAAGDEQDQTEPDGIIAGLNQRADSYAVGDDVQLIPPGTTGLSVGSIVIGAGANGTIESTPGNDDQLEYVTGYETSRTCDQLSVNAFEPCHEDIECQPSGQGDRQVGGICAPPERLVRVGSLRNGDFNRAWFVLATGDLPTAANFGDLRAHAGEDLKLAFLQDLDHDGLFAQEEFLAGSLDSAVDRFDNSTFGVDFDLDEALKNPNCVLPSPRCDGIPDSKDTDFDGLGDYAEVKVGWKVSTEAGLMQVFSSPRSRDTDGDGLLDPEEADLRNFCAPVTKKCTAGMSIDAVCSADADCPGSVVLGRCATMNDPRMDGLCAFQSNPVTQNEASAIIAGPNGEADSVPEGANNDDEVLVPAGVASLSYDTPVIGPGKNGVIDTVPTGDDQYTSERFIPPATDPSRRDTDDDGVTDGDELLGFDVGLAIKDGGNGIAETAKEGDDVQRAAFDQPVVPGGVVILPGRNERIDSMPDPPVGDDVITAELTDVNPNRYVFYVDCGPNRILDTIGNRRVCTANGCVIQNPILPNGIHAQLHAPCPFNIALDLDGISETSIPLPIFQANNAVNDDFVSPGRTVVTDPLRRDTDSDTIADGVERDQGSDPTVPDGTDFRDADQDGMFDAEETDLGWDVSVDNANPVHVKSSPYVADTDGDGLPDLIERYLRTDPNRADTDGDGITDFDEVADFPTYIRLSAPYPGIVINGSASKRYGTDPRLSDTDADGLTDYEEVSGYAFVNPAGVTTVVVTDPRRKDTDGDGLNDKAERDRVVDGHAAQTDATNRDTDGDGKLDGAEDDAGGDPLTPDRRVTVVFTALNADKLVEDRPAHDAFAALGWWFVVTGPDGVEHLISASGEGGLGGLDIVRTLSPFNNPQNPPCKYLHFQNGQSCSANVCSFNPQPLLIPLPRSGTASPTQLQSWLTGQQNDTFLSLQNPNGNVSGTIAVGSTFQVASKTYTVTSSAEPSTFLRQITFQPPIKIDQIQAGAFGENWYVFAGIKLLINGQQFENLFAVPGEIKNSAPPGPANRPGGTVMSLRAPSASATIAVGSTFRVPNSSVTYTITDVASPHVFENVTFTPPLAAQVPAGTPVTLNNKVENNSFTMRPGQSFSVHGLWADLFSESDGSASTEIDPACGQAPYFVPRLFISSCYLNFLYRYEYTDIADPSLNLIKVDTTDNDHTTTRSGDGCAVNMHFEIHVD